jgi:hypothetical protein
MINKNDKKSLCFAASHRSHIIPNLEDIDGKENLWLSDAELKETMGECIRTVVNMQKGVPLKDDCDQFTSRGLEYMTPNGFDIATSSQTAIHVVLEEQKRQKKETGKVDPELLASAIESFSRHRMRIAQLAGQKDERMANMAHDTKLDSWSTSNSKELSTEEVMKQIAERRMGRTRNSVSASTSGQTLSNATRRRCGSRDSLNERRPRGGSLGSLRSHRARGNSRRVADPSVAVCGSQQVTEDINLTRLSLQT